MAWDRLVSKFALHIALSLLKLKSNSTTSSWSQLIRTPTNGFFIWKSLEFEFGQNGSITDEDFMIHILNNLPEDYDVILKGLENHLTATWDDALTINVIQRRLNHMHEKIKNKKRKSQKRKSIGYVQ